MSRPLVLINGEPRPDIEILSITYTAVNVATGQRVPPAGACPICCCQPVSETVVCEHGVAVPRST